MIDLVLIGTVLMIAGILWRVYYKSKDFKKFASVVNNAQEQLHGTINGIGKMVNRPSA